MMLVDGENCIVTLKGPGSDVLSIHCPTISFSTIYYFHFVPVVWLHVMERYNIYMNSCSGASAVFVTVAG